MEKALKLNHNESLPIDPREYSLNNLIVIVFTKNRATTYPMAVSVARGAFKYAETIINKQIIHIAVFANTKDDIEKALALLSFLSYIKGVSIFVKGRFVKDGYKILSTLECYSEAIKSVDYKAHCHSVMDDPFSESYYDRYELAFHITLEAEEPKEPILIQRYIFPCKYLLQYFKFQIGHPASFEDQIQNGGVVRWCDWCPNFQPKDFKRLPAKTIYPNGTVIIEKEDNNDV